MCLLEVVLVLEIGYEKKGKFKKALVYYTRIHIVPSSERPFITALSNTKDITEWLPSEALYSTIPYSDKPEIYLRREEMSIK